MDQGNPPPTVPTVNRLLWGRLVQGGRLAVEQARVYRLLAPLTPLLLVEEQASRLASVWGWEVGWEVGGEMTVKGGLQLLGR